MNILIRSAKIIDSQSKFHQKTCDILIENGKFTAIASILKNTKGYKEIALKNLHISTGWFDTSVSLVNRDMKSVKRFKRVKSGSKKRIHCCCFKREYESIN